MPVCYTCTAKLCIPSVYMYMYVHDHFPLENRGNIMKVLYIHDLEKCQNL